MALSRRLIKRSSSESDLSKKHPDGLRSRPLSFMGSEPHCLMRRNSGKADLDGMQADSTTCRAYLIDSPAWLEDAKRFVEQELVLEGTLYVSSVQTAVRMESLGFISLNDDTPAPDPAYQVSKPLSSIPSLGADAKTYSKAVCLATPEAYEEEELSQRIHEQLSALRAGFHHLPPRKVASAPQLRSIATSSSPTATESTELVNNTLQSWRHNVLQAYAREDRRRRKLELKLARTARSSAILACQGLCNLLDDAFSAALLGALLVGITGQDSLKADKTAEVNALSPRKTHNCRDCDNTVYQESMSPVKSEA